MRVKTRAKSVRRVTGCLFCSCTCSVVQITARGQRKHSSISLHTMMSCCIRFVAREDFCLYGWVVFHGASNHIFFTHGLSAVSRKNIWIDYLGLTVVDRAVVNRGVQIALLCCLHFIWEFSQMVGSLVEMFSDFRGISTWPSVMVGLAYIPPAAYSGTFSPTCSPAMTHSKG